MTEPDRKRGWQGRARAVRNAEERKAADLSERGWTCFPPELMAEARELLAKLKEGPR